MKKGDNKSKNEVPVAAEPVEPEVPQFGHGRFEYKDGTTFVGEWKLINGNKLKHGHGKVVFVGCDFKGAEEYEGEWSEDKMEGHGRYSFTSGAVYTGSWAKGKMEGKGSMINPDGTSYEGEWQNGLMHGEGCYVDGNKVRWEGIFINGGYDSKVQKKIKEEKIIQDKIKDYQSKAKSFFVSFSETFGRSDKKTFKDNLGVFFASADSCGEYVAEPYAKYEERAPDKWNELVKALYQDGAVKLRALKTKDEAKTLKPE